MVEVPEVVAVDVPDVVRDEVAAVILLDIYKVFCRVSIFL